MKDDKEASIAALEDFARRLMSSDSEAMQIGGRLMMVVMPPIYLAIREEIQRIPNVPMPKERQKEFNSAMSIAAANIAANVLILGHAHVECKHCLIPLYEDSLEKISNLLSAHVSVASIEDAVSDFCEDETAPKGDWLQ